MMSKIKKTAAFTLLELMTVLIIVIMLASVAFPIYQEYITRAQMAESESVISAIETSQIAYYYANGSFISTPPNPASVPGMASLGDTGTFGASSQWTALGMPISAGSQVNFSYQSFAGQTPPDSTTPIVNGNLYAPGTDMDLERAGTYSASLEIPFMRQYALRGFEFDYAALGFDMMAFAQRDGGKDDSSDKGDGGAEEKGDGGAEEKGDGGAEEKGDGGAEEKGDGGAEEKGDGGAEEKGDGGAEEKGDGGADGSGDDGSGDDGADGSGDDGSGDDGGSESPVIPCASFGVSKPSDFGVQEGIAGYSWVVNTASGNLEAGTTCSLSVKVITVRNGDVTRRGMVNINAGE